MSCHHETAERDGHTLDVLTDDATGTRLTVDRLGAQPIGLARRGADGAWTGFLWQDGVVSPPPSAWVGHCPVMGYYILRLLDGHTAYRGREIRGGTHSFLRTKTFAEPEFAADGLTYTMTPDGYEAHEYPYHVTMRLTYTLEPGGAWRTRFRFESGEPEVSTHVSFGLHPGFALGSLVEAQILLPPGLYRRHLAPGNFLSGETTDIQHPGGPMPFDKARLIDSYLLELVDVPDPTFVVDDARGGRRSELRYAQAPFVTLWSDGHDYVCVEPCWGMPDAHQQAPFEQKLGIQEIAPGGTLEKEFTISAAIK